MQPKHLALFLTCVGQQVAVRIDTAVDDVAADDASGYLGLSQADSSFCGSSDEPRENADTCPTKATCCCMGAKKKDACRAPSECKKDGGSCAEMMWKPSLSKLQDELERRQKSDKYKGDYGPDLERSKDVSIKVCKGTCDKGHPIAMCSRMRGTFGQWGVIAAVTLGGAEEMRELADSLRVWHWNPNYPKSPYTSGFKRASVSSISPTLKMSSYNCRLPNREAGSACCLGIGTDKWTLFLSRLKLIEKCRAPKGFCFQQEKSRRRFTFTITAPINSKDLEFRAAKMESKFLNGLPGLDQLHDLKSKHAFLAQFKDWVIYAGEMWVQPRLDGKLSDFAKTGQGITPEDAVLVIDNNSGTMAPGAEDDVRLGVQKLLMKALGVGEENIEVCQGPFSMKRGMATWKPSGDACPHNPVLYVDPLPEASMAAGVRADWLKAEIAPEWSRNAMQVFKKIKAGATKRRLAGYAAAVKEASLKALPCDLLPSKSCGEDCACWTDCRRGCGPDSKLSEGFLYYNTGVRTKGGVVYHRNCHIGTMSLCSTLR